MNALITRRPAAPRCGLAGHVLGGRRCTYGQLRNSVLERVLPTGNAHLVIRLAGPPLTLYEDPVDGSTRAIGH